MFTSISSRKNLFPKILIFPFFLIISSCGSDANLEKVRSFSQNADKAKDAVAEIADDFYRSCLRAARYKAVNVLPSDSTDGIPVIIEKDELVKKIADLESRLNSENSNPALAQELQDLRQKLEQLAPNSSRLQDRVDAQKECNKTIEVEGLSEPQIKIMYLGSAMKQGNSIIYLYPKKLGELAAVDLVNFDSDFDSLKSSSKNLLNKLTTLLGTAPEDAAKTQERANAGFDLANFILTQIFNGKRTDTLKEAITQANQPLKNYAEGLQIVVQKVYIDQYLKTEESSLDNYYIDYIEEILDSNERNQGNSVITITDLLIDIDRERWNPEKDQIQKHRELAYAYIDLLKNIVASHEELAAIYNKGEQPDERVLQKAIESNNKAMKKLKEKAEALEKLELK
jgi:hypothetical protein